MTPAQTTDERQAGRRVVRARWAIASWLGVVAGLATLVALSNPLSKGEYDPHPPHAHLGMALGWYQFDAGWYERIARDGYTLVPGQQSSVAFFPAYPLAMRFVGPLVGGNLALAGIVITFVCGICSVGLLATWLRGRVAPQAALWTLALFLLYPYSWYLVGAVYADALCLAASIGAFVALERGHPVLAGALGAVASATRPIGPAIVVGLALRAADRRGALRTLRPDAPDNAGRLRRLAHRWQVPVGVEWRKLRPGDAGVLLAALGFGAYVVFLWARFGDPLAFSSVQRYWDQPSGPITWSKAHLWANIVVNPISKFRYLVGCLFQGALTMAALFAAPRVARRFGWGYGSLVLICMGLPFLGSKDFQGTGRYLLAAFPLFALVGEWMVGQSRRRRGCLLGFSALSLLVWTHLYARGFYVA